MALGPSMESVVAALRRKGTENGVDAPDLTGSLDPPPGGEDERHAGQGDGQPGELFGATGPIHRLAFQESRNRTVQSSSQMPSQNKRALKKLRIGPV